MFSFLSSGGNKILEIFQGLGYFDRCEISKINAKYITGLELRLNSDYVQEYDYDSTKSACFHNEIGILYKLKYGEIGARVICKPDPIAQFNGKLRYFKRLGGYELTSMCILDIYKHKIDKWNFGLNMIAGNLSAHFKLYEDKSVFTTRHRIHPRFVTLTESSIPYKKRPVRFGSVALGFEFELSSKTSLQVMVSQSRNPTFALQHQFSDSQCLLRVYRDAYSNRTGVSFSFHPCKLITI